MIEDVLGGNILSLDFWLGLVPHWLPMTVVAIGYLIMLSAAIIKIFLPIQIRPAAHLVYILGTTFLVGGSYVKGRNDVLMEAKAEIEKSKKEVKIKTIVQKEVTEKIVTQYVDRVKIIEAKGAEIEKIITTKDDTMCTVPESFVRVHDLAAMSTTTEITIPDPTQGVDGTPSGIALSETERVIADNYEQYHKVAEQLRLLQEWVAKQKELNQ